MSAESLVREQLSRNQWGLLATQGCLLGLDIGGYGLRAALLDLQSHAYAAEHREVPGDDPEQVTAAALELAHELLASQHVQPSQLVRVGVGFGGPVDSRVGKALFSPRKPAWDQFPLQARVEQAFDAVVLVDNDANLIALAEATFGVAHGKHNVFYLHLSSGVGGGMVLGNSLYHGASTTAGEIGHAALAPTGSLWRGREFGTLEQMVSIRGLLGRAAELGLETNDLDVLFGDHPVGRQVLDEAAELLALRLSQLIALLDPELIVLGGILTRKGGESLLRAIGERLHNYASPPIRTDVPILASVLGYDSVAVGALALGLHSLQE
jgi:glucokinase